MPDWDDVLVAFVPIFALTFAIAGMFNLWYQVLTFYIIVGILALMIFVIRAAIRSVANRRYEPRHEFRPSSGGRTIYSSRPTESEDSRERELRRMIEREFDNWEDLR